MSKSFFLVMVIALIGVSGAMATNTPEISQNVEEYTLRNGLKIILLERHHSPTVACQIAFKVGSNNERPGVTGAAHMLEHMMFKGTQTIGTKNYQAEVPIMEKIDLVANEMLDERLKGPGANVERIQALQAKLKELQEQQRPFVAAEEMANLYKKNGADGLNAYTSDDYTNYILKLPSNKVELWCWLESDRIAHPVFREFYSEKEVVREERRMRYETSPEGSMWEVFQATAFMAHPYGWQTIGWASDIENYRREVMQEFFTRYYAPNNAVITWVGDFKAEEAITLIQKYFESIPAQTPPPPVITQEPEQKGERRTIHEFDANPSLVMGWHTVALTHPDQAVCLVIQDLLADGRTSRLYESLRTKTNLVSGVGAYQDRTEYPGLLTVFADPVEGVSIELVEQKILDEINRLCSEPVSDWELQRAKNKLSVDFMTDLESNFALARYLTEFECKCSWRKYFESEQAYLAVTAEDVLRVAKQYLQPANCSVVVLRPTAAKSQS